MAIDIKYDHFSTAEEARAEIEAAGYHPVEATFEPEKTEDHWHDFDSMVFVLDGEVTLTDIDAGETCTCGKGTRVLGKAGVAHREDHQGYKALIGLSVPPAQLTQPINKPLPVRR